jgi:hypothetical protein
VADRFAHWRQPRPTSAEPIPPYLWEHAIALTTTFSLARVATRLRVSGGELQKRCAAHRTSLAAPASAAARGFVDVSAAPLWPLSTAALKIELHRTDGTRLRIHAQESQLPLTAVIRTFLETP